MFIVLGSIHLLGRWHRAKPAMDGPRLLIYHCLMTIDIVDLIYFCGCNLKKEVLIIRNIHPISQLHPFLDTTDNTCYLV